MKKPVILFLVLSVGLFCYGQTSVEGLKKELSVSKTENLKLKDENKYLKEKLLLCTTLGTDTLVSVKPFSGLYDIKVVSCKGNRSSQTVELEIIVEQSSTNQQLTLQYDKAAVVDVLGKSYLMYEIHYKGQFAVYTDVPVRLSFIITNVLPGTDLFKLISIPMGTGNLDQYHSPDGYTEIRNLKIVW